MRTRIVAAAVAGLMAMGTVAAVAASTTTDVACTITDNTLSCPLPETPPVTVSETPAPVTVTQDPVTVTVTAAPTSTANTAAPTTATSAAPSTSAAPTTSAATSTPAQPAAWPNASNTGVPAGTTLTLSSQCTITVSGTVIDRKQLNCPGGVTIHAKNVTIKNSKVNGHIWMPTDLGDFSLLVQDSEVDGGQDSTWPTIGTGNIRVVRSNLHGGHNGLECDDTAAYCELIDSYIHGQYIPPNSEAHLGGFLSLGAKATCTGEQGRCLTIRHNTVVCDAPVSSVGGGCTGDINLIPHFSALHDVLIENNYMGASTGLAFCTYGGGGVEHPATNIVYRGNVFERGSNGKCGAYGPVTDFVTQSGSVWENNTWADTGSQVPPA